MTDAHAVEKNEAGVSLDARIAAAEAALGDLYKARRGTRTTGTDGHEVFWCTHCGANTVNPHAGEDTCRQCLDHS